MAFTNILYLLCVKFHKTFKSDFDWNLGMLSLNVSVCSWNPLAFQQCRKWACWQQGISRDGWYTESEHNSCGEYTKWPPAAYVTFDATKQLRRKTPSLKLETKGTPQAKSSFQKVGTQTSSFPKYLNEQTNDLVNFVQRWSKHLLQVNKTVDKKKF